MYFRSECIIAQNFSKIWISSLIELEKCKQIFEKYFLDLGPCTYHSVEISQFFYHSDFTWNQILGFEECKICHFKTFRASEYWFLWIFALFESWKSPNSSRAPKMAKTAFLELWHSPKLISRKIWMIEKSWNSHSVHTLQPE